jgi:hypothetical protein
VTGRVRAPCGGSPWWFADRARALIFASQIATEWRKSREAIFAVGRLLIAAKQQLKHGAFSSMVENDLPFSSRTAQRLMAIARDKRLNTTRVSHLMPVSWGTLYELSLLRDDDFDDAIADGAITADMSRSDAVSLVEQCERDRQDAAEDPEQTDRFEMVLPTHEMLSPGTVMTLGASRRSMASSAAPDIGPVTADVLHRLEDVYTASANRIVQALLVLAAEHRCNTPKVVRKILAVDSATLDEMRRGIDLAGRLKIALGISDPQGNPSLQLVEH